jgi:hypothetical protein
MGMGADRYEATIRLISIMLVTNTDYALRYERSESETTLRTRDARDALFLNFQNYLFELCLIWSNSFG